jgi:cytochrome c biogenesis protein CcmG/thiol:disulfide interchange protein DsbE
MQAEARSASGPSRRVAGAVGGVVLVGALLAAFVLVLGRGPSTGQSAQLGRPAPPFSLERLDGGRLSLAELRGRPIVLNFWASWCLPCREEAPMLAKLAADHSARGLVVVGVVYQDSAANATDFIRRYGLSFPALLDPSGRTALDYGVLGLPVTIFIDAGGIIGARQPGPLDAATAESMVAGILP